MVMATTEKRAPRLRTAVLIGLATAALSVLFFLYAWPSLCANPFESIEIEEVLQPNGERVRLSETEVQQLQRYLRSSRPFSSIGASYRGRLGLTLVTSDGEVRVYSVPPYRFETGSGSALFHVYWVPSELDWTDWWDQVFHPAVSGDRRLDGGRR